MATKIVTKSGSGAPATTDLVAGELAVDLTNKRLYTENGSAAIIEVGSNPYNFTANHDGSAKLATTATGIDVTGSVTADGLTVSASATDFEGVQILNTNTAASPTTASILLGVTNSVRTVNTKIQAIEGGGDANETSLAFFTNTGGNVLTKAMTIDSSQNVGIGTSAIDGTLHVHTASAGTVAASAQADDLVIENSTEGGMTIITPDDQSARIRFTSPSTNTDVGGATIFYRQNINTMQIGTAVAGGVLSLASGAGATRMTIDSSGNVGIGITPAHKLSVFGTGVGNATVQIEGEGGADPYINFLTNNTQHWSLGVDDSDADKFKLSEHSALGTNDYFVVDVTGNVGIGTSSPSSYPVAPNLVVDAGTNGGITVKSGSSNYGGVFFADGVTGNEQYRGFIQYNHGYLGSTDELKLGTSGATRMTIDSSGKVGIGMSPTASLSIRPTGTGAADSHIGFGTNRDAYITTGDDGIVVFREEGGTERMRIDASGNLLVGQSSTTIPGVSNTTAGVSIRGIDGSFFSRALGSGDTNNVVSINRSTEDGNILGFQKDGTTVGSIGAFGGTTYFAGPNVNTGGFRIDSSGTYGVIIPTTNTGTNRDASMDLGYSSGGTNIRFRDLYLSGEAKVTSTGVDGAYAPILRGVYSGNSNETNSIETSISSTASNSGFRFNVSDGGGSTGQTEGLRITRSGTYAPLGINLGGTGAAHLLDDYEEVNFTATIRGSTAEPATLVTVTGFATKIGRVVQYSIGFEGINTTGYAGAVSFTGLPFANNGGRAIGNVVGYNALTFTGTQLFTVMDMTATTLQPHSISSASVWTPSTHNVTSGGYFWLTGTYMTTA